MSALVTRQLSAGYGTVPVVRSFDLDLEEGQVLALLGPNGAGKTTLLLTIAGLLPRMGGEQDMLGEAAPSGNPMALTRRGLVLVPDDRSLFATLTTRENIELGRRRGAKIGVDDVLDFFPSLRDRLDVRAGALSGGEQQMLAMARALIQEPRVLLIDELSMGLAPIIVRNLLPIVRRVAAETGTAVVLVEQHVRLALAIADTAMVLVHGDVALAAPAAELLADVSRIERAYLGEAVVETA